MTKPIDSQIESMQDLVPVLSQSEGFAAVVAALQSGQSGTIDGAWGGSCALTAAAIAESLKSPLLIVLPRLGEIDEFAGDFASFLGRIPEIFPAWETLPGEYDVADSVFGGRLRVLNQLGQADTHTVQKPLVMVSSFPALLQPVPSQSERREATRTIKVGDEIDTDAFMSWLIERGFERTTAIELPGEFSMHGGILDIFSPDATLPIRIEFFGDEVESIRRFDVETQRTVETCQQVDLILVSPVSSDQKRSQHRTVVAQSEEEPVAENLLDNLPADTRIVLIELPELIEEGKRYLERLENPRGLFSVPATLSRCTDFPSVTIAPISAESTEVSCHLQIESIERFTRAKSEMIEELNSITGVQDRILICCHNQGEEDRLQEILGESDLDITDRITTCIGNLALGFRIVPEHLVVLSDHELFGRADIRHKPRKRKVESRAIDSFLDLNVGDFVVHLSHGIARFKGLELLEKEGHREEHLSLEFRDKVQMYVPVSLVHLVQKYIGGGKHIPQLSKLGTKGWANKKEKAAQAVRDMASDMLRLQAMRSAQPGLAYPLDSHWQKEFEASFPYTETEDQLHAINDVRLDMERPQPMDRLICGDVGYGKTEVAIRAAFKAIDAGKQVAVLVPTTVLAEQHTRTFSERMADYPITIEGLSRFKTKKEQRIILEGMASGSVDLVIGTHRLIQKDIKFKDLGLLIIDEEQRFGVEAKEMLKHLRLQIEVLTLSATPVPRTLHMSLLGIRDISNLTTAPRDRVPIETRITRFDPELIRHAMVRELNRNGQVYFVHNRVHDLKTYADRIQQIVPEANIGIGHGQMKESELETAMLDFVSGKNDIFVCTTIVESGLDIPNANTIFIHDAGNYGLSDLHQLRGRVGRSHHRAYCYLLLRDGQILTPVAAKRLKAIEEYSELGAGFKIAMRDLEIRGAGNILGTEQSGHIAAVGYELYCQLLENACKKLKNEPIREHHHVAIDLPCTAFLPSDFIPPGRIKIEIYRKLSAVRSLEELSELEEEIQDRFGNIPNPACNLILLKELQILAQLWQVDSIRLEDHFAVLGYRDKNHMLALVKSNQNRIPIRIVDHKSAYIPLPSSAVNVEAVMQELKSVLQQSFDLTYNPAPSP
ncbi:transcription-repair coupling factor [Gimesia aquarii]|uniref:Transcription-repair-coupling factor n=1 Tax=Gimesia aquarii TaxID=2527964 RepID=A0A517WSI2_9PLAN|nr:transcription-repair coupling factor [Gimesia aquarii]QDU08188.1 Transcription-repair-coupling factor [Gimesia aquarii]